MTDAPKKFIFPEKYNNLTNKGTEKSKSTISIYKTHLNRITALTGLDTVEQFMKASRKVNKVIADLNPIMENQSVSQRNTKVRIYYSALFTVLPEEYIKKPNPFYKANKKWQDGNPADFKKIEKENAPTIV